MNLRRIISGISDEELEEALVALVPREILIRAARATDCTSTWRGQKCIEAQGHSGRHRSMWQGTERRGDEDTRIFHTNGTL